MILTDVDTKNTYEAMKRGQWPKANPKVAAAWKRLQGIHLSDNSKKQESLKLRPC